MNDCGVARPLVLVLEGVNDCEFLFRLSQRLHAENPQITDLTRLHADGRIYSPASIVCFPEPAFRNP